jgi:hypothetical protein
VTLATLAAACHYLGDTTRAAKVRELLEPYADRNIATGLASGADRIAASCYPTAPGPQQVHSENRSMLRCRPAS